MKDYLDLLSERVVGDDEASDHLLVVLDPPPESGFWTTGRKIGGPVVGLATTAGTVFAAIQIF